MEKKDPQESMCQRCLYYDYDEESGEDCCQLYLDEDEMVSFIGRRTAHCPYFRDYDEYKTVRKQN